MRSVEELPGARCVRKLVQKPRKTVVYHRGVWEFDHAARIPGTSHHNKWRKSAIYYKGVCQERPGPAGCPGDLSTGYPHVVHNGGVWEFEPKLPLWFNSLEAYQICFVMRKAYLPQPLCVPSPHVLRCVSSRELPHHNDSQF